MPPKKRNRATVSCLACQRVKAKCERVEVEEVRELAAETAAAR